MNVVRKLASCRQTEETGIVIVSRYSLYSLVSRPSQRGREGLATSSHFGLAVAMDSPKITLQKQVGCFNHRVVFRSMTHEVQKVLRIPIS